MKKSVSAQATFRKWGFLICVSLILTASCSSEDRNRRRDYFGQVPEPVETFPQKEYPGSLWKERNSESILFMDHKAGQINDIVTVLIVENSSGQGVSNSKLEKTSDVQFGVDGALGLPSSLGMNNFLGLGSPFQPSVSAETTNDFEGKARTTRTGSLSGTITCRVVKLFPNGNLEIRGSREITINREQQFIMLSGVIRQEDIDSLNVVRSDRIADARIEYYGEGVLADKETPGWLARVLDWVWPF